jgi:hypothetical protein
MDIKPVVILSRGAGVFVEADGRMNMVVDTGATHSRIQVLLKELETEIGEGARILEPLLVSDPSDFEPLFQVGEGPDVLLVYFLGVTPIERLLRRPEPIIAFSGPMTPAMALYAVGEERRIRKGLFVALDYQDIRSQLRVIETKAALARTRILLFGYPPSWHLRWYGFPDLEGLRRKLGVEFIPVELRELLDRVGTVAPGEATAVAETWRRESRDTKGPSPEALQASAATYLAMKEIMERKGATAMTINCLEITQTRKFAGRVSNPCMGMQTLRDQGIPAGCEMDIPGLLSMILLGHLSRRPAFLGNIVQANPAENLIKMSHCILPTRMYGFDSDPLPFTLCDFHGKPGVTTFTRVPGGETVTIARVRRNMERMTACSGELVSCEDTEFCRNTLGVRIAHVRRFVEEAEGNHHALVFGNWMEELELLCNVLDCDLTAT